MYVDYDNFKSGKTTRLVDSLVDYLESNPNETVMVVAPTYQDRKKIINRVADKCYQCQFRAISSYKMLDTSMKHFVDDYTQIDEENLFLCKKSYYTTNKTELMRERGTVYKHIWDYYRQDDKTKPIKKVTKLRVK